MSKLNPTPLPSLSEITPQEQAYHEQVQRDLPRNFVANLAHGMLVQRVIENAGQPALPPDVLECKLKLRDLHANTEGRFVTLDTDHFRSEENTPFDLSIVEKGLRDLHAGTSAAFFAAINEEGAASWEQ